MVITPTLMIPLPDGRNIEMIGDSLTIRITDEYVEINPLLDGIPVASIEATETRSVILDFAPKS